MLSWIIPNEEEFGSWRSTSCDMGRAGDWRDDGVVAVEHDRSDCVTALLWRRIILSGNDGSSSLCFDFFSLATNPKHAVQRINRFCVNSRVSLCGKQLPLWAVRNNCIELPRRRLHVVDGESGEQSVDMRRMRTHTTALQWAVFYKVNESVIK